MRAKILMAFERAEVTTDDNERRRLLTFVVVGGGPTGVELAGAMAELAKRALARDFRNIDPCQARIVLLQRGPRILPNFSETLSTFARTSLEKLGVEVQTGINVDQVDQDGAIVSGHRIEARTVIWAAGVMASPAGRWLAAERDAQGRVLVEPDLSAPEYPEVFVIGDTAGINNENGRRLPGIAPVANQQGHYVGKLIRGLIEGRARPGPFRYRHYGNMATIGRSAAVADFCGLHFKGLPAWILWGIAHIYFLIGLPRRGMGDRLLPTG
jgi:NADH dehydrogenase